MDSCIGAVKASSKQRDSEKNIFVQTQKKKMSVAAKSDVVAGPSTFDQLATNNNHQTLPQPTSPVVKQPTDVRPPVDMNLIMSEELHPELVS